MIIIKVCFQIFLTFLKISSEFPTRYFLKTISTMKGKFPQNLLSQNFSEISCLSEFMQISLKFSIHFFLKLFLEVRTNMIPYFLKIIRPNIFPTSRYFWIHTSSNYFQNAWTIYSKIFSKSSVLKLFWNLLKISKFLDSYFLKLFPKFYKNFLKIDSFIIFLTFLHKIVSSSYFWNNVEKISSDRLS